MSKGAFYSALLFIIWEIIYKRKYFLESFFKTACLILVAALLFVQSSISVQSNKYEINETGLALSNLVKNKNTIDSLFSLYFDDGRLYSTEGNLNWRLEIWQDVIFDLNDKDILLTGYGYDSVIPAMERPDRQGLMSYDKEQGNSMIVNENVHSYIVNILARGGLIQVVLIILFYLMLLYTIPPKRREHMLQFLIPFLLCSMFDIGMEGVQYPILFFLSLSYIAKHSTKG
jgi:O-antigen ligase